MKDNMNRPPTRSPQSKPRGRGQQPRAAKPQAAHNGKADKPVPSRSASGERKGKPATAREVSLELLVRTEQEKAFSNLLLNQLLRRHALERADKAFVTELAYGTMQRLNTIDYFLERFVAKGIHKLEPWVRCLLRLSFFQLYYLDRVPDHAVVHEAVSIAKRKGHQGIAGMVNAVLRNVIRSKETLAIPANLPAVQRIALEHSHPEWLVREWLDRFGEETAVSMCASNNEAPHVSLRVNALKHERASYLMLLLSRGIDARPSEVSASGIVVRGAGNMALTDEFERGEYTLQDESSMLVADALDPRPGMLVLDCCAAPGGKTTHLAEKMGNSGTIHAYDVHEHKQALIDSNARRLGITCLKTGVQDARELGKLWPEASFDRILLDAPCSGLGVIRRKPDAKWSKQPEEVHSLAKLQGELLAAVAPLLKPGGVIVYSTCTIGTEENESIVNRFLEKHAEFAGDSALEELISPLVWEKAKGSIPGTLLMLPHYFHSDGFYIARLKKKRSL